MERERGESANDRNDRAIRVASQWYSNHLKVLEKLTVILLTNDRANKKLALSYKSKLKTFTGMFHFSYDVDMISAQVHTF